MAIDSGTYTWPASAGGGGGVTVYANFAAFPASSFTGDLGIAADTGILYEWRGSSWSPIGGPSAVLTVGTFDSGSPSANGAHIDVNALIMQSASASNPGLVNLSTQTLAGVKTFSSAPVLSSLTASLPLQLDASKNIISAVIANSGLANMADRTVKGNTSGGTAAPSDLALGAVTEATSSVLTLTGWTSATIGSPTIQVKQSNTTTSGYLSSTDWNTFNGKQAAGSYITALTGDVTASGPGSVAATLAATTNATLATLSGLTSAANLATVGTITSGTWSAGTIALNKGGTGQTTKAPAFDALQPMSTLGDIIYGGASGTGTRLAGNTTATKNFLTQTGNGSVSAAPAWGTIANTDLSGITNTQLSGSAAITNANLATMVTSTVKGNLSGGTATPSDVSATAAATATTIAARNSSGNAAFNNILLGLTSTATAAGTTTLTSASKYAQQFTGSTTQTCVLPDATTLTLGEAFLILNRSTGVVTVNANGGGLVQSMATNTQAYLTVTSIGTSAGTWDVYYTSSVGLTNPMTTGGDLIYGGAAGVATRLANGSSGQFLKSAGGTSAPTWSSFTAPTLQVFTSGSGTYTTPAGCVGIKVTCIGGGGAGAGPAATGAAQISVGSGGGGAGTAVKFIASPSATYAYVVGAGGAGAAGSGGGAANNGADSTFNTTIIGTAGAGGTTTTAASSNFQGGTAGSLGTGGDINYAGSPGGAAYGTTSGLAFSGQGGSSGMGGAGVQVIGVNGAGSNALNYGGGGSGGVNLASQSARNGGNGSSGIIFVEEFYT